MTRLVAYLRSSRAPYLFALVITVVGSAYAQYLWQYVWPGIPLLKAQPPGVYLGLLGAGVTFLLWVPAPRRRAQGPLANSFLVILMALWVIVLALSIVHEDLFNHGVWVYPVIVAMLWLKWPTSDEARSSLVMSGWLLAGILAGTRLLELLGLIPMATVSEGMTRYERTHYWLPLSGWLGPEGRWPGPLGHNANTGSMGAYLVVLGVALRRRYGIVFVLVGTLTLFLTMSRGSMIAAIVGLVIVLLLGDYPWTRRFKRKHLIATVLGLCVAAFGAALLVAPNLTGRTSSYWPMFLDLWRSSPWTGVGITGIAAGPEFIRESNGHNLLIDALAKYGIVAALLVGALLVVALTAAVKAASRLVIVPLGLISTFLVIGATESDFDWITTSTPWLFLVLAVAMATAAVETPAAPRDPLESVS